MSLQETEAQWQEWVVELAAVMGWRWGHIGKGRVGKDQWVTPVSGPLGRGHADLILARERVVYAELKAKHGRLRNDQVEWIQMMRKAGAEVYVWRPQDRKQVEQVLK